MRPTLDGDFAIGGGIYIEKLTFLDSREYAIVFRVISMETVGRFIMMSVGVGIS